MLRIDRSTELNGGAHSQISLTLFFRLAKKQPMPPISDFFTPYATIVTIIPNRGFYLECQSFGRKACNLVAL